MALGKNFRLPTDCKPVRYSAHLAPDLETSAFEGRMELEVRLDAPRREIHLHAVGLEVSRARARVQDRSLKATLRADALASACEAALTTPSAGQPASSPSVLQKEAS